MSRRNKLEKFAELLTFPNVYQNYDFKHPHLRGVSGEKISLTGFWRARHFTNDEPLIVELACGGGEYSLEMARRSPNKNFIGVDIKGNRIWKGARKALREKLPNVAFLRTRIEQLDCFFAPDEIDEIWITFPDPFLRESKSNRRLTAPNFLKIYQKLLTPGGRIHLKTDSPELYDFTLEVLNESSFAQCYLSNDDIYGKELLLPELDIKTYYEEQHLANQKTIKYIQFGFEPKIKSDSNPGL